MSLLPFKFNVDSSLKSAKEVLLNLAKVVHNLVQEVRVRVEGREVSVGLVVFFLGANVYYWERYSFWSRRKVKGPRPLPVVGNLLSFFRRPRQELELEWPKKYGKIYGYYMGTKPYIVCADADVMRRICVKDFDKFPNHRFVGVRNKYQKHFVVFQEDDDWRGMRSILTPTFSSGKIKILSKILQECTEDLVTLCRSKVEENNGEAIIETRGLFASHSIGCALNCFYGLKPKRSKDSLGTEEFARQSRHAVEQTYFRFIVSTIFPERLLEALNFPLITDKQMKFFAESARNIIAKRQNSQVKHNDYLQSLLEAKLGNEIELANSEGKENHHALDINAAKSGTGFQPTRARLTEMEMFCQVMMLMMVATETTSTLITHTVYLLAHHQDIQARLFNELKELRERSEDKQNIDYEQLTSCVYLDCVISECLRLMTPALAFDRVAAEDYYIEDYGITIPKGTCVNLAFYAIHHDPDYWSDPETFNPDRFLPENKEKIVPGSYSPFGIGPRACIAFRFALTEAKMAIAKLLSQFHFDRAPGTVYPPEPVKATLVLNLNKNLLVKFNKRS